MADPVTFALTEGEKHHPLWVRLRAHFTDRLAQARVRNDRPDLREWETATLRGQIKELKAIIALGDDRPLTGD